MAINPKNIVIHEIIGLTVRVINHADPSLIGVEGRVIDETLNTLKIEVNGKEKILPKRYGVFLFRLPDGRWTVVRGEEIFFRPWERTKRGYRKYLRRRPVVLG